jgi:hypothetical protein
VKFIKLKRTQTVCIEIERKRERNREQTERKQRKMNSHQRNKKYAGTRSQGCGALVPWYQVSHLSVELEHLKIKTRVNRREVCECEG